MQTSQRSTAQIVIPTFNRAQLLLKTLNSALNQTLPFDRITISDNSDSTERQHETRRVLGKHLANHQDLLVLTSPPKPLSAPDHAKFIQDMYCGTSDYTMLLHDDDTLEPDFLAKVKPYLDSDRKLVAVAANAWMVDSDETRTGTLMRMRTGVLRVNSPIELLRPYLEISASGPPPLDGYLYRSDALRKISFDSSRGGKYSDVAALANLAELGPILWHCGPLMSYLQHEGQDSSDVSTKGFRNLVSHLEKTYPSAELEGFIAAYRLKHFRMKAQSLSAAPKAQTRRTIRWALFIHTLRRPTLWPAIYLLVFRRWLRR
ncbi:MAG: glycosyltransferase family A protein [Pseudomonadota bacterium]|nr:glycosyltransferase family A protein [Pseudomonadota bacterium]